MELDTNLIYEQKKICNKYGYKYTASDLNLKVGVSLQNKKEQPIHALRHPLAGDTTGWYIWWGEYSERTDFFQPIHTVHLIEWCPLILPYLGLPAGCRILIAEDGKYVDIWEDLTLLNV
jgi:hypothetical protein